MWLISRSSALRGALGAGAIRPQELPRVDAVVVAIIPGERDGVASDLGDFGGPRRLFVHRDAALRLGRLADDVAGLLASIVASGARAGIAQIREGVRAGVAVVPFDLHARAAGFVDFDGFRLDGGHGLIQRMLSIPLTIVSIVTFTILN